MGKSGQFVKGDKRINRKGRPKSFDQLRKLAQLIANEEAMGKDGIPTGKTNAEVALRFLMMSKHPADRKLFLEVAYGKVPDSIALTGDVKVVLEYINRWADENATQPE